MPGISRALATFALMLVGLGLAAVIAVQWVIRPAAAANSYLLSQTDGTQPEYGLPTGVGAAQGPALRPPHSQVAVAVATPTCGPQWVAANTPNVGAGDNALTGVSVISSSEAWAVGFYTDTTTGIAQTLVEKFNGSTWSIIPSPNMGPGDNYLQAVAARTSSDIWAVGYYRADTSSPYQTLILHWDGAAWSHIPSPSPGAAENYLYGVAAVSANDAWAVGYYANTTNLYRTLTLHWDGTAWSQIPSPNPTLGAAGLRGVVMQTSTDVWAVGAQADITLTLRMYALRWNGTSWTTTATPNAAGCLLTAAAVASAGSIWAVGGCQTTTYQTAIIRWTGASWVTSPSPNPGTGDNLLGGLAIRGPTDAWAVGGYNDTGGPTQTLALHWDGMVWAQGVSENPGTTGNALVSAGADPLGIDLWAVGAQESGGFSQTLAENFITVVCEPTVTPTRTASPGSTVVPTVTSAATHTSTSPPASTPTSAPTSPAATVTPNVATPTPTACTLTFTDVPTNHTFYTNIRCLACRGIISGYSDGTFRPGNDITRGQIAKMVSNAAGFQEPISGQSFEDVPTASPFYDFIERLYRRGHMGGYQCGLRDTEPCVPPTNRPYFRPNENATRGQISKIVSNAAGFQEPVGGQFYTDVTTDNPFYSEIMRLTTRGVMSGYPCGTVPHEPCDGQNRPYFRWGNPVTRGQASKIVANTFFPGCSTPRR